jgi:hypothetical protein
VKAVKPVKAVKAVEAVEAVNDGDGAETVLHAHCRSGWRG